MRISTVKVTRSIQTLQDIEVEHSKRKMGFLKEVVQNITNGGVLLKKVKNIHIL